MGTAERFVKDGPRMPPKYLNDVHEIVSPSAVMVRSAIHGCQGEKPPRTASETRRETPIRSGRSKTHMVYDTPPASFAWFEAFVFKSLLQTSLVTLA